MFRPLRYNNRQQGQKADQHHKFKLTGAHKNYVPASGTCPESGSHTIGKFPLWFGDSFAQDQGKEKEHGGILSALQPFLTLSTFPPNVPNPNKQRMTVFAV